MTTIPITCDPERKLDRVPLSELEPFQGGLKSLGDVEYAKLKQSISEKGFIVPCFAWRNGSDKWKLLDGHQRVRVIRQEKWKLDGGIPIVEIEATDEKDAKEKLLAIVSRYGRVDGQGLYEFLDGSGIDLEEWTVPDLPDLNIDEWLDEFVRLDATLPLLDGEEPEIQQWTFSLHKDQMEQVRDAIGRSKKLGDFVDTGNENENGNALARICELFAGSHG